MLSINSAKQIPPISEQTYTVFVLRVGVVYIGVKSMMSDGTFEERIELMSLCHVLSMRVSVN